MGACLILAPYFVPGSVSGTLSLTSTPTMWARVVLSYAAVIGNTFPVIEFP